MIHLDKSCYFRTGNDISSGMEANIPYMVLCEVQRRFHHDLIILIWRLASELIVVIVLVHFNGYINYNLKYDNKRILLDLHDFFRASTYLSDRLVIDFLNSCYTLNKKKLKFYLFYQKFYEKNMFEDSSRLPWSFMNNYLYLIMKVLRKLERNTTSVKNLWKGIDL